jgi:hypothetical protein
VNPTAPEGSQVLAVISTPYGSDADYVGAGYSVPTKQDVPNSDMYEFIGWEPKPENITGIKTCYAQFTIRDDIWYTLGVSDISNGYTLNSDKTMSITKCTNKVNAAVRIPESLSFEGVPHTVTALGGFTGYSKLELISLPNTLIELSSNAFSGCSNLSEITLPDSLRTIGDQALGNCAKLTAVNIPANVQTIGNAPLCGGKNTKLKSITVADGNNNFKVINDCLIDINEKKLLQGLSNGVIPDDGAVTSLGAYCFHYMPIKSVEIPSYITSIPTNAFSNCKLLETITLPRSVTDLAATSFAWCDSLTTVNFSEGLKTISTYVFNSCPLMTLSMPSSLSHIDALAFGKITTLQSVTFKKALNEDNSIKIPYIDSTAFADSSNSGAAIVFNVPWSEEEHLATFTKDPTFGAKASIFNYNYQEETN